MKTTRLLFSFGNRKLPSTTSIFNLGSATDCPSMALGLCSVKDKCYALKAEKIYPATLPYRRRQLEYWNSVSAEEFATNFYEMVRHKKNKVNALRVNESGDFYSQKDVDKLEKIAFYLGYYSIKVYVYTARMDLDFSNCKNLTVIGSSFFADGLSATFVASKDAKLEASEANEAGCLAVVCPADCKSCTLCMKVKKNSELVIYAQMH